MDDRRPDAPTPEERLERGEILTFSPCPFALPSGDAHDFLLAQRLKSSLHKHITFNPETGSVGGHLHDSPEQAARMQALLSDFGAGAAAWLAGLLPHYAAHWRPDRVSYRPEEEALRKARPTARNDLLHLDAFPSRPTRGWRILRLFVNVNPTDDRVWVTSETFARLLERYGATVGLPGPGGDGWARRLGQGLIGLFQPGVRARTDYDSFMLRLHHFLKTSDAFQEGAPRRFWRFPPGSCWLLLTDTLSHADLRGQYALEHSFFIAPASLALPAESPPALLESACGRPVLARAA